MDVALGARAVTRSLTYVQDYANPGSPGNSRYTLPAAPEAAFSATVYPAALFMGGFAANLGLTVDVAYMLPVVNTATPPPPAGSGIGSYSTYSLDWSVGAKVRLPLGLYVTGGYGDQRYQLTPSSVLATGITVPMTEYTYLRGGAGIRLKVTPDVSVLANAGYLQCLRLGQIGGPAYFPKGTGAAFEAGIGVGYRISSLLEIRGGADIRRYGLAFHVTPASLAANPNIRVAGGAVDQYITVWAALAVLMGGASGDGGGGGGKAHHGEDEESDLTADKPSKEKDQEDESDDADSAPEKKPNKKKSKRGSDD